MEWRVSSLFFFYKRCLWLLCIRNLFKFESLHRCGLIQEMKFGGRLSRFNHLIYIVFVLSYVQKQDP